MAEWKIADLNVHKIDCKRKLTYLQFFHMLSSNWPPKEMVVMILFVQHVNTVILDTWGADHSS